MKRYEFIDHTADIAIKAYGSNLEDAFASAGDALFQIITGNADIEPVDKTEMEAESIDPEGLLVGYLSNLLVLFEVDQLVLKDFEVTFAEGNRLKARAWGEKYIESKHGHGYHVKGVSYHMMEIVDGKGKTPSHVQVLFDV